MSFKKKKMKISLSCFLTERLSVGENKHSLCTYYTNTNNIKELYRHLFNPQCRDVGSYNYKWSVCDIGLEDIQPYSSWISFTW